MDVVYTDFSKAFDRIDHSILLIKLRNFGFSDSLVKLIKSYLTGRMQCVKYLGHVSDKVPVLSGVPQGSVLGPLFFAIFINDVVKRIGSEVLLLADDLKMFRRVSSNYDCYLLQKDINEFYNWSACNNLPINLDKCHVMTFSNKNFVITNNYTISSTVLKRVHYFKDLGIMFDPKLTFSLHYDAVVNESLKNLGFIIRSCKDFKGISTFISLFFAFVRSKLEYGNVVWAPLANVHIDIFEKIQRRFLKFLVFRLDGVYPPRGYPQNLLLERFGLQDLQSRRIKASLNFLKKLINSNIDCPPLLGQINFHSPLLTLRHPNLFYLPTPRLNVLKYSPISEMCNNYHQFCDTFELF